MQYEKQRQGDSDAPQSNLKHIEEEYVSVKVIGQGTYGKVFKVYKFKNPEKFYAIKKISRVRDGQEGFPYTSIREIKLLQSLKHENIVRVHEIFASKPSKRNQYQPSTFMVMEYVEFDLWNIWKEHTLQISQTKNLIYQLLKGLDFLHQNNIVHRDLKAANLLLNKYGILKIADFGLGRHLKSHNKNLTQGVVTFPYRAPELILGDRNYNEKVDVWSVGCLLAEFFIKRILFNEEGDVKQMMLFYQLLGEPQQTWPEIVHLRFWKEVMPRYRYQEQLAAFIRKYNANVSDQGIDLLRGMLEYNPKKRLSAEEALKHPYFTEEPLPLPSYKLIGSLNLKNQN